METCDTCKSKGSGFGVLEIDGVLYVFCAPCALRLATHNSRCKRCKRCGTIGVFKEKWARDGRIDVCQQCYGTSGELQPTRLERHQVAQAARDAADDLLRMKQELEND